MLSGISIHKIFITADKSPKNQIVKENITDYGYGI